MNYSRTNPPVVKRDDLVVYSFGDASFAVLFSFGVVVFWNVPLVKQQAFVKQLQPIMKSPVKPEVTDQFVLVIGKEDRISFDRVELKTMNIDNVIALSFVFAQAVVLERMEQAVDQQLYELNRILRPIEKVGRITLHRKQLLRKLGFVLRDRTHSFYEYGFQQTPPEAWGDPRIERLFHSLVNELEIPDRIRIVNEKWGTVSDTTQFVLGLLSEQKNFRLDITLLLAAVVVDMLLTLWQVVSK
jgi:uncharacterized Rmd1/YagE family protein